MIRLLAACLAVASCASLAQAQTNIPTASPVLTLAQAIALASTVSPSLQAAEAGQRAAAAARTVAGLRPNPTIVAETENVGGSGAYRRFDSAETTVGLALPLELGGKRTARLGVANARRTSARLSAAVAENDLTLRVTRAYLEAASTERRLTTAREQVAIAEKVLRAAKVRVAAGRASPIEQQRADVLRINAATAADRAKRLLDVARDNLARLIGQPIAGLDTAWFTSVAGYGPPRPIVVENTLALATATADVTTASAQVALARSQRIPDVTLTASARRLAATNDTAAVFGVSIPFPLFSNGTAAIVQARAERDQVDAQRRLVRQNTEADIADAQAEVANAADTARTAMGPALAAATETARIARIGYREGKFGQLDLLDAERTLSETRVAVIDALTAFHDAGARLSRLTADVTTLKD
ncbi:TolC family protein [Sphingosinicellaceae bacterium]|nr:TolC family protein [Sphingosinicellaceae bacterium]